MSTNKRRCILGCELMLAEFFLTGCGRAPSFDVLGSFFPAWLACLAFTLIDARTWWAVANFREGQLQHIAPGMRAEVYVMSKPDVRFTGVVDSIGFGVTPDADVVGRLGAVLPDVQRTLNWVHLATRYPVRVRVENPPPDLFRVSESAVVVIRGR